MDSDTAELVQQVLAKVEEIKELQDRLASLKTDVRDGQTKLTEAGVHLSFPVLDNEVPAPPDPEPVPEGSGQVVAAPVVPAGPEKPEPEPDVNETTDFSTPAPNTDKRSGEEIRGDAIQPPSPQEEANFKQTIANNFEKAILAGYADAEQKARKHGGL